MTPRDSAWEAFSRFIRIRDCLRSTGGTEWGRCYTCTATTRFQELDAGHFVDGRTNSVLFDEEGVRGQCQVCNRFKGGQKVLFRLRLVEEIGEAEVEKIEAKRHQPQKLDFAEIRRTYLEKSRNLINSLALRK